jgi:hypothetical protein
MLKLAKIAPLCNFFYFFSVFLYPTWRIIVFSIIKSRCSCHHFGYQQGINKQLFVYDIDELKGSNLPVLHHPKAPLAMSDIFSPEFVSPILRSVDQNVVNEKDRQSTKGSGKVNSLDGKIASYHQSSTEASA